MIEGFQAILYGLVQGVGFRYYTTQQATMLGLSGWVRNRADGTVEVWAQGTPERLSRFKEWLQHGPPGSRVEDVTIHEVTPRAEYKGFGAVE
jgi:acylphosphatase